MNKTKALLAGLILGLASAAWAADRTLNACADIRIDTSTWKQADIGINHLTVDLPASFKRDTESRFHHGGTRWVSDTGIVFQAFGAQIESVDPVKQHTRKNSVCPGTLDGQTVAFKTSIEKNYFLVSAEFIEPKEARAKLGPHMILILAGEGKTRKDQEMLMKAIRSVSRRK